MRNFASASASNSQTQSSSLNVNGPSVNSSQPCFNLADLKPSGFDPITVKDLCNFSPYKHIGRVGSGGRWDARS